MLVSMLGGVAFISCGDDDEDEPTPNNNQNDSIPNKPNNDTISNKPNDEANSLKAYFAVSPKEQMEPSMSVSIYPDSVANDEVVYAWDFGDGIGAVWQSNTEYQSSFVHTYDAYGEYIITLTVRTKNTFDEHKDTIKILPAPPVSKKEATKYEGIAPFTLTLEEDVMYYDSVKWDIRQENIETSLTVRAGAEASYTFDKAGKYFLDLTAYGPGAPGEGLYLRTDTVEVWSQEEYASHIHANFGASPQAQMEPSMNVSIHAGFVQGENVTYTWNFGDGTTEVWNGNAEFMDSFVHTYEKAGDYTITLTVDNTEETATAKQTIHIYPARPCNIRQPMRIEGNAPFTLQFDECVMYHDVAKWDIKLLENNTATPVTTIEVKKGEEKQYTFNNPGLYLLELSASGPGVEGFKYMRTDTVSVR